METRLEEASSNVPRALVCLSTIVVTEEIEAEVSSKIEEILYIECKVEEPACSISFELFVISFK